MIQIWWADFHSHMSFTDKRKWPCNHLICEFNDLKACTHSLMHCNLSLHVRKNIFLLFFYIFRASYVSVLTIVAFSTERYLAICYPLYLYTMSGLQRAVKIIACLWLIAFLSALPFSFFTGVNYLYYPPNSTIRIEVSTYSKNKTLN